MCIFTYIRTFSSKIFLIILETVENTPLNFFKKLIEKFSLQTLLKVTFVIISSNFEKSHFSKFTQKSDF